MVNRVLDLCRGRQYKLFLFCPGDFASLTEIHHGYLNTTQTKPERSSAKPAINLILDSCAAILQSNLIRGLQEEDHVEKSQVVDFFRSLVEHHTLDMAQSGFLDAIEVGPASIEEEAESQVVNARVSLVIVGFPKTFSLPSESSRYCLCSLLRFCISLATILRKRYNIHTIDLSLK